MIWWYIWYHQTLWTGEVVSLTIRIVKKSLSLSRAPQEQVDDCSFIINIWFMKNYYYTMTTNSLHSTLKSSKIWIKTSQNKLKYLRNIDEKN
jgi:hypothetical protein